MKRFFFLIGFLLLSLPLLGEPVNIVKNPSFEEGMPSWWDTEDWNTSRGKPTYVWDDKVAHTDKRSVSIENQPGTSGVWVKYLWKDQGDFKTYFKPDTFYQMSAWVKAGNTADGSGIILDGCEVLGERPMAVTRGTHDWKKLVIKGARLKEGTRYVGIVLVCRGGKIWFDDVEIVEMEE